MYTKKLTTNNSLLIISLILLGALCYWVYSPGLDGDFYFDDFANIQENLLLHIDSLHPNELWQAMWSGQSGHLKRPIPMLSFALNHYFFGLDPGAMKIVNLGIHLLTGLAIFFLVYIWMSHVYSQSDNQKKIGILTIVVLSAWLLHPFNLTSVLYVVQRMTSLAALFTILSLLSYTLGRRAQQKSLGKWGLILFACPIFGLLALFSKENAILIPYFILCIELFIFNFNAKSQHAKTIIKSLVLLSTIVPILFAITFLTLNSEWLHTWYQNRDFTLSERLLTESRILCWYMRMILIPNLSHMGLFIDSFPLSTSIFEPLSTIAAIIFLIILLVSIYHFRKSHPMVSFGIAWFFAGHLLESTFIPLELVFEHRNYLPSLGLIIAAVSILSMLLNYLSKLRVLRYILPAIWILALAFTTHIRADYWKNAISLALYDVTKHPESVRTNIYAGLAYMQGVQSTTSEEKKMKFTKQADEYFLNAIKFEQVGVSASIGRLVSLFILKQPVEDNFIKNISDKVRTHKLNASTQSALHALVDCKIANACTLDNKQFEKIINNAIKNDSLNNKKKASLLIAYSEYYAKYLNNIETAELLTKDAINLVPTTIRYRLTLVNWLIRNNKYNDAQNLLNEIRILDKYNKHVHTTNKWQIYLNQLQENV